MLPPWLASQRNFSVVWLELYLIYLLKIISNTNGDPYNLIKHGQCYALLGWHPWMCLHASVFCAYRLEFMFALVCLMLGSLFPCLYILHAMVFMRVFFQVCVLCEEGFAHLHLLSVCCWRFHVMSIMGKPSCLEPELLVSVSSFMHGISFGVLCICSCIILFFHLVVPFAVSSAYSSGILHVSFMEDHCERSLIAFIQLVSIVVSGALSTCVHCGTIRSLIFDDEWTWCSKSLVH